MNSKILLAVSLFITTINFSCDQTNDVELDLKKIEKEYLNTLPSDPLFSNYVQSVYELGGLKLKKGVDRDDLQSSVDKIGSELQIKDLIEEFFTNPEEVMLNLRRFEAATNEFKKVHKDFYLLNDVSREYIMTESIQSTIDKLSIFKANSGVRANGECEEVRDSQKQTCFEAALVGAAACGLLTPTLGGALLCGVFVIAGDEVCHRSADREYEICINNN